LNQLSGTRLEVYFRLTNFSSVTIDESYSLGLDTNVIVIIRPQLPKNKERYNQVLSTVLSFDF